VKVYNRRVFSVLRHKWYSSVVAAAFTARCRWSAAEPRGTTAGF